MTRRSSGTVRTNASVVSASLPALGDHGIDAGVRGLERLFDRGRLLPDAAIRGVQPVDPGPGRHVHEEHDQLHAFRHADIDVFVGRGRTERRGVVQQVDAEKAAGPLGDHPDERLRARRRFDGVAEHADAACIRDGRDERGIRDEPHTRAHERVPDAVLARESRAQDASTPVPVRQLLESLRRRFPAGRRRALGGAGAKRCGSTSGASEQRQHPPPIEPGLCHVRVPSAMAPSVAGGADATHNSGALKRLS